MNIGSSPLIETIGLNKQFQRQGLNRQLLSAVVDVNLNVAAGEFLSITGPSGSGKTTLLTLLAGLATPTSGEVRFRGQNIYGLNDAELSLLRSREISFIPQGMGLLGNLNVRDNVRAPLLFAGDKANEAPNRADELLEAIGLSHLAEEKPRNLSGGETRRAAIARALFNRPSLILADEPTNDLDPENTILVMELLKNINASGTAIILVTHSEQAAAFAGRRMIMNNGRLQPENN